MAPRRPESRRELAKRLRDSFAHGASVVRFGRHHFSHAVCRESDQWRVRALETTAEERDAYMAEHGMFMPESQEAIAKPRTLLFESKSLDDVLAHVDRLGIFEE
jgi:hypothetical protein